MTRRDIELHNAHVRYEARKARERNALARPHEGWPVYEVERCKCPPKLPDAGVHLDGRSAALCVVDGWLDLPGVGPLEPRPAFIEGAGTYGFWHNAPGHNCVTLYETIEEAEAHQDRFFDAIGKYDANAHHQVLDLSPVVWDGES